MTADSFDVVIAGAGIVGLAHALVAARKGLRVAVVERHQRCVGASIRNFGFITVTGQGAGDTWRRARRSRDVWQEVAPLAGIAVEHRGLWVLAQRPQAMAVLQAFKDTEMGEACTLHSAAQVAQQAPFLRVEHAAGALYSPHELRVESRTAVPALAAWLASSHGVVFHFGEEVLGVSAPQVHTSARTLHAQRVVLCPGAVLHGVAAPWLRGLALTQSKLQMLRVRAQPGFRLDSAVMSDLSLVRYSGYAALPQSAALLRELERDDPESLRHGIHLIAVQSADGTLVVGDHIGHGGIDARVGQWRVIVQQFEPHTEAAFTGLHIARRLRGLVDVEQALST